jgi:hypothetical protein
VAEPIPPGLLLPLAALGKWLGGTPAKLDIVGGVAVSFLARPRFAQDIDALTIVPQSLLGANPNVDVESVRRWVRDFAIATSIPDLIEDFDKAVARWQESP